MKHGIMVAVALLCVFVSSALAETDDVETNTTYKAIEFRRYGLFEGNLNGTLRRISEGVDMRLIAEESTNDLDVQSKTVEFSYEDEDAATPNRIVFEGDVIFVHSQGTVRSEKAVVDFDKAEAVFTGSPSVDNEQIQGVEAEYITLDLNTQDFIMGPGKIREIRLSK